MTEKNRLNRPIRLVIMFFLIILFLIISPLIILYTMGYRYNFDNKEIKKTGVISIDAEPDDALVFVNNELIKKSMPMRLTNIPPGTYNLRIEKNGYWDWNKDITVESTKTTYIKEITLFKKSLPIKIFEQISDEILFIMPSNDGRYIVMIIKENSFYEVELVNTATQSRNLIMRKSATALPEISWSPYDNHFLAKIVDDDISEIQLVNAENLDMSQTYHFINAENLTYQWQKNSSEPTIFINRNNTIYKTSVNYETEIAFTTSNIWYIDEKNNLWQVNNNEKSLYRDQNNTYNLNVPIEQIIDINDNRAILKCQSGHLVFRFDSDQPDQIVLLPTENLFYNQGTQEWINWSDFELWTIYRQGSYELLNRTSEKITLVRPLDEFGLLAIASENSILGFNPGYYITHELFSGEAIEEITANKQTRNIYFLGSVGQNHGLFGLGY